MKFSSSRDSADRIGNGISRTTLNQADDTQLLQELTLDGNLNESMKTIEHAHPYGFSSYPKRPSMIGGAMQAAVGFISFLYGNRSHGVAFSVSDRRYRLYKMKEGETAVHDDQGQWVYLTRKGALHKVPNGNTITHQVDAQQQSQQGGQGAGGASGAGGSGGSQGGNSGMGQDATKIPQAASSIIHNKDCIQFTVGGSVVRITADQIYIKSPNVVTDGPTFLNRGTAKVMTKSATDANQVYAPPAEMDPLVQSPIPSGVVPDPPAPISTPTS
jgi:phage gp45-like